LSGRPPYYFTAYGLAVKHGFQGTEQEWLESLNGDNVVLRYQDGILQWKLARAGEDSWAPLFDLGQIQRWAEAAEVFRNEAAQHSEDAGVSANEATAIAEELAQRSEALARSITTSMVLDYHLGSLYTHTGAEADGADYANRIRSGFFPVLSGKLNVYAPTSVKSRLVFYNADLSFRSSVNEFASGSYSASTTAVFARLIVGYDSDAEVADVATLAAMVAVCMPVEVPEGGTTFHITITGNDADGYAADKTYEEIREAWKQGQSCICNCAGLLMPLVMLGGDAQFDTVWNGQEYRVYISPTGNVRVDISELGGGGSGGSGVYVGTEEPTDPNVYVWINPEGDADEPESGAEYVLPVATSETLGGVMPVAKTDDMTVPVGVDALGRLYAEAGSNNGGIDLPTGEWKQVFGFTTTEEVSILKIDVKDIVETLINSKKMMIKFEAMPVSSSAVIGSNPTGTFKWISGGAERIWLSNAMFLPWGTAESGEAHTGVLEIIKDTYSSNISIWHQYLKVANRSAQKAYNKDYIFGQSSGTTEHRFVITANDTVIGSGSTFKIFVI